MSMFFRNLTLFRFPVANAAKLGRLEQRLAEHVLRPCGPLELSTRGFVSPFGRGEAALTHGVGPYTLVALGGEDKLLPGSVINQALAEKCGAIERKRGKPPGARERRKLKDEVITELMPRALCRPSRTQAYLDTTTGWLVVDSASTKVGEGVCSKLREALGSFPMMQAEAEESPRAVMTEWLITGMLPKGFTLGDEALLRDPADEGALIRARRQELSSDEIREHLKAGKQVTELALVFAERVRFTLDENLKVRKFKLLDIATESLESGDRESANAELDARFALMTGEVTLLLERLEAVFGVPRPVA
jgi:recombination associated protein RdgC